MKLPLTILALSALVATAEPIDANRLADAIKRAENSTRYPYGIKSIDTGGDEATARRICLNTIRNQIKRHNAHFCGKEFIDCLADRYCPPSADKVGNVNWKRNVRKLYEKGIK